MPDCLVVRMMGEAKIVGRIERRRVGSENFILVEVRWDFRRDAVVEE